jgi:hypothetical protein
MNSKVLGFALAALVLGATACSGSSKVSVSAKSASATDTSPATGPLDLGNGIAITHVRMAVRKVELEHPVASDGGTPGSDDGAGHMLVADHEGGASGRDHPEDDGDDDADEVKVGPCLIDIEGAALKGALTPICEAEVPAGTFRELEVVIGVVPPALAGSNAGLAAMNGQSVIVDGTITTAAADGTTTTAPFSFQSTLRAEQKQETEIVVVSGTPSNVTLSIDPTGWFAAADGSRLDPNDAAAKAQIEHNIKASLKAFCDRDRDGDDDHGHHDGSGHH